MRATIHKGDQVTFITEKREIMLDQAHYYFVQRSSKHFDSQGTDAIFLKCIRKLATGIQITELELAIIDYVSKFNFNIWAPYAILKQKSMQGLTIYDDDLGVIGGTEENPIFYENIVLNFYDPFQNLPDPKIGFYDVLDVLDGSPKPHVNLDPNFYATI